jgi:hypothetical protein
VEGLEMQRAFLRGFSGRGYLLHPDVQKYLDDLRDAIRADMRSVSLAKIPAAV